MYNKDLKSMSIRIALVLIFVSVVSNTMPVHVAAATLTDPEGILDTSFSSDGLVTTAIGSYDDKAGAVAVQQDGKIVVAGNFSNPGYDDFFLARYSDNGSLDTSFDTDGIAITSFGNEDVARALAILEDGRIVIAGNTSQDGSEAKLALARYNSDGSLDTSFDVDGKVTTDLGSGYDSLGAMAIQSDGKIVVVGSKSIGMNDDDIAVIRYNSNGSLDTTFDADGVVTTAIGSGSEFAASVVIQPDGKIIVGGTTYNGSNMDFALVRYDGNGSLDTSFDSDGIVTKDFYNGPNDFERGGHIALQADGKIIIAGNNDDGYFLLARYNNDGSLDATFDTDGLVSTSNGGFGAIQDIALQANGKIVIAGYANVDNDFAVVRYKSNGALDTSFDSDGKAFTDFGSNKDDLGNSVAIQPDGKIVVAGYSYVGGDYDGSYDVAVARYIGSSENVDPITNCAAQTEISPAECDALVALYNSTNGADWSSNTGWLQTNTPCSWYGVYCGPGHVAWLLFQSNHLSGTIPPELSNLINLSSLDLSNNQLSGTIPPELGSLIQLQRLNLGNNQLSGPIPTELGNLTQLEELDLPGNQLSGSIPTQLGNLTNLRGLLLALNQLSGSIPAEIGNLTQVQYLALNGNQLSGSIPLELGNLINLTSLDLGRNQLSGFIPPELGSLINLGSLDLSDNQLSGSIPTVLGNLAKLQHLSLWGNQLSGSIPTELGNLTKITYLYLFDNQLSDSIPTELGNLTQLTYLYLDDNQLSGSIPTELGNLTQLKYLYLFENQLSGEFPASITNLVNLVDFRFDTCQGLTSTNPSVITFLNGFKPNWNACDQNMVVQRVGSGILIPNGDTTPSYAEGTEFGGVHIDRAHSFEFKVFNTGSGADLYLTGTPIVVISGDSSFTVKYQPYPTVSSGPFGNSFTIRFSPSSAGLHTATVSIASNDPDDDPYTFTIQGVGAKKDAYESDNDFSTAKTIIPGAAQAHSIYPAGDHDYEKFTVNGSSSIVLETSGPNGYDTEIALYDASHNLIAYDNDGGDFLYSRIERTCANLLPAGDYYLMTYIYEGVIPQYQLAYSTAECPPIVKSIVRANPDPTAVANVNFTVTFSEPVTGVDTVSPFNDFALTTSPGISGASITGVSGSGTTYTVTVNTGSGNGTIRLDVLDNNSIVNAASNPLGGAAVGDGNFTTGDFYTINRLGGDTTGVFRPTMARCI